MKNDGAGSFTNAQTTCLDPYEKADGNWTTYVGLSVRLADMNGDRFVDIIVGESSDYGNDRVVFNNGNGTFNFRKADDILVK